MPILWPTSKKAPPRTLHAECFSPWCGLAMVVLKAQKRAALDKICSGGKKKTKTKRYSCEFLLLVLREKTDYCSGTDLFVFMPSHSQQIPRYNGSAKETIKNKQNKTKNTRKGDSPPSPLKKKKTLTLRLMLPLNKSAYTFHINTVKKSTSLHPR